MNIQEKIEALETEFNEKIKALKAEVQREEEFPKDGDVYWLINTTGETYWVQWRGTEIDNKRLSFENAFKTKEEAEFAVEKLKVEAELRKFSRPASEGSAYIYRLADTNQIGLGVKFYSQSQGTIYFESAEKAQQAIESVGIERIKKYIFGVED